MHRVSEVKPIQPPSELAAPVAAEELLPLVYDELRRLAAYRIANEKPGQTLQATALVHEAWLRLGPSTSQQWRGREHFFSAAAEAMRRILVDNARRKLRQRHGGRMERVECEVEDLPVTRDDDTCVRVSEALDRLAEVDARHQGCALARTLHQVRLSTAPEGW